MRALRRLALDDQADVVMIAVYGLDLALAKTGLCLPDGRVGNLKTTPHTRGAAYALEGRCFEIRDALVDRINRGDALRVLVVLEDLPQARAHTLAQLGILHGIVRAGLLAEDIDYAVVTPSQLKMYATGKGVGPKANMRVALNNRSKGRIDIVDEDQCDAWWLHAMGEHALGRPVFELPAANLRGLAKVQWPTIADDEDERATLAAQPPHQESATHG